VFLWSQRDSSFCRSGFIFFNAGALEELLLILFFSVCFAFLASGICPVFFFSTLFLRSQRCCGGVVFWFLPFVYFCFVRSFFLLSGGAKTGL